MEQIAEAPDDFDLFLRMVRVAQRYLGDEADVAFSAASLQELLRSVETSIRVAQVNESSAEDLVERLEGAVDAVRLAVMAAPELQSFAGRLLLVTENATRTGLMKCPPGPS